MLKWEARRPQSPLKDMKYVVVSGGVLSGLGKGVTASSIGVLLKSAGLKVTAIKIDPYLNSDAGTMSPFEHGEVFVLDDGGEADLDLGNYERFCNLNLYKDTERFYHIFAAEQAKDKEIEAQKCTAVRLLSEESKIKSI